MADDITQLSAQVAHLEAELGDVHERRVAAQRAASERATLEAAVVALNRDIDAATSPALGAVQDEVAALHEEIAALDASADFIALHASQPLRVGADLRQLSPPLWERLHRLLGEYEGARKGEGR